MVSGAAGATGRGALQIFFLHSNHLVAPLPCANLEQLVANWSRDMRGSLHLVLLLILSVSGQQGEDAAVEEGVETDSSDEANPSGTSEGATSEEEACSDCEETGNTIEEEGLSNNATELKVLESATYLMASVGSTSISVRLDRVEGQENLQMVCQ